jgi:hypothetical protein
MMLRRGGLVGVLAGSLLACGGSNSVVGGPDAGNGTDIPATDLGPADAGMDAALDTGPADTGATRSPARAWSASTTPTAPQGRCASGACASQGATPCRPAPRGSRAATAAASTRRATLAHCGACGTACTHPQRVPAVRQRHLRRRHLHRPLRRLRPHGRQRLRDRHPHVPRALRHLRHGVRRGPTPPRAARRGAASTPAPRASPTATVEQRLRGRHPRERHPLRRVRPRCDPPTPPPPARWAVRRGRLRDGLRRLRRQRHQRLRGRHPHERLALRRVRHGLPRAPNSAAGSASRGAACLRAGLRYRLRRQPRQRLRGRHPHSATHCGGCGRSCPGVGGDGGVYDGVRARW